METDMRGGLDRFPGMISQTWFAVETAGTIRNRTVIILPKVSCPAHPQPRTSATFCCLARESGVSIGVRRYGIVGPGQSGGDFGGGKSTNLVRIGGISARGGPHGRG
jgi:hypothetical protein